MPPLPREFVIQKSGGIMWSILTLYKYKAQVGGKNQDKKKCSPVPFLTKPTAKQIFTTINCTKYTEQRVVSLLTMLGHALHF